MISESGYPLQATNATNPSIGIILQTNPTDEYLMLGSLELLSCNKISQQYCEAETVYSLSHLANIIELSGQTMVGVPRSTGCSVCVRRRVKCDETRPSCTKCRSYGVSCPGYQRVYKFVDRTHRRQTQPPISCEEAVVERDYDIIPVTNKSVAMKYSLSKKSKFPSFELPESSITSVINPSAIHQAQCLSAWINDFSRTSSSGPDEVTIARMFTFVPVRLGISAALDRAVRCITVHHLGITKDDEDIIRYGRYAYGRALSSLQRAIYDPEQSLTSETICATMILSIYELFACTKQDSWMKHAGGVSRMIQIRGPASFENDFDLAMLAGFKGMLIMEALFSGKTCFLERKEWQNTAMPPAPNSAIAELYQKANEFGRYLSACPWLVTEGLALRESDFSKKSTQERVVVLVKRTIEIYGQVQQWYEDFATFDNLPVEVPSSTNDMLYPVVYRYHDPIIATIYCGYYATILILNTLLIDAQHPAGDAALQASTVDKVCKSLEYMAGTGIMGPYRVGFALRVAFEMATIEIKLWIRRWLLKFEKFYKASSPDNYPPIEIPGNSPELLQDLSNDQLV